MEWFYVKKMRTGRKKKSLDKFVFRVNTSITHISANNSNTFWNDWLLLPWSSHDTLGVTLIYCK